MAFELTGGRRLLLAGSQLGWFWIAVGALALVLLVVLYREERRLVARRTGLGLLLLRIAAAVALVVALFEPIAARTYRETIKGRVIVGVDISESMSTADAERPAESLARLATTLRLSPGDRPDLLSRREVVRRLLEPNGPLRARMTENHSLEAFAFARDLAPASLDALNETLRQPPRPGDLSALTTDWQPVLTEALKNSTATAPVIGVVLLTDGRQNAPGSSAQVIDRLAARGIPVYSVLVGSKIPPRDAAVAAVRAPESVFKGDVANVEATVKLDGYKGQDVTVSLERPGAPPLRQTVRADADSARPTVSFRVPLDQAGTVPLSVAVSAMPGDRRPDNDRHTAIVQVADDHARVLVVDGEARWEFRYLRNALTRDPRVTVEAVVFRQPPPASTSEPTYGTALPEPSTGTSSPDPLGGFDAVVLGDVEPDNLSAEAWSRLERYVSERGGTLIISPGPRTWPGLHARNETLRKLLPVLDPALIPAPDAGAADAAHAALPPGVAVSPASEALANATAWPMLQLAPDASESARLWSNMPGLPWALGGKPKPGATVLATAGDTAAALIAAQPYGLGKVLWVGTDSTWRWRYRVGDTYHHRFWGQAVRWAASGKLAAGNDLVRFGPVRPRLAEGEAVVLQARIAEGVAGVGGGLLIAARVFRADKPGADAVAVVPLHPVPGRPRTFEGSGPPLGAGSYVVRLDAPQIADALGLGADKKAPEATLQVSARDTSERIELAASPEPLEQLAASTGGRVIADDNAGALPSLLRARTIEITRTAETPLWDQPAALLVFLVLLTTEWVIRKRVGLP